MLLQTIDVAVESNNASQNPKEGIVFILFLRKYRVNEKECNPVPGNMYGVMYFRKWGHKGNICKKANGNPKNYTKKGTVILTPTLCQCLHCPAKQKTDFDRTDKGKMQ